jgi:23S rRNA (guanosine2251-2'-O)-methyltransferase
MKAAILLENIRSAENVGAIFRTADAAGISHIYLGGYTPAPLDRFNRPNKKIATRALGAENTIPWSSVQRIGTLVTKLQKEGWQVVAIEQSPKGIDYKKVKLCPKTLFVLGNEVEGVSPKLLKLSDMVAEIPMRGKKESLNVSVAAGVALFRMLGI